MKMVAYRRAARAAALTGLTIASPALATRTIQIDVASQENSFTSCGAGCLQLSLASLGASVGQVNVSPNGYMELVDGRGGLARFSVGETATPYQVVSGYTFTSDGSGNRIRTDFISFYSPASNIAVLPTGNRPAADFQIQFAEKNRPGQSSFHDLEIGFAYNNPPAGGPNRVAPGASIGYSGATLGTVPGGTLGFPGITFGGFPDQRFVTNAGGLLLGTQATDSEFEFVVGNYPDPTFRTVLGLVSQTFNPRYAAAAPVPEPATWGMLVLGFGAVGGALRRLRPVGRVAAA